MHHRRNTRVSALLLAALIPAGLSIGLAARGDEAADEKAVLEAETKRVAVIEKVKPSVVAVFAAGGNGGGSGVLIDKDGYAPDQLPRRRRRPGRP